MKIRMLAAVMAGLVVGAVLATEVPCDCAGQNGTSPGCGNPVPPTEPCDPDTSVTESEEDADGTSPEETTDGYWLEETDGCRTTRTWVAGTKIADDEDTSEADSASDGDDPCADSGTPNRFNVFTGDAQREVTDLKVWGAVGRQNLVWARNGHSRLNNGAKWFGHGHVWRHSYQWELTGSGNSRTVYQPAGTVWAYSLVSNVWKAASGRNADVLTQSGTTWTLKRKNGTIYTFHSYGSGSGLYYQLDSITDPVGNVTTLTYDAQKKLTRVTEPAGRFLQVNYQDLPFDGQNFKDLASAVNPGSNEWREVSVSDTVLTTNA